MDRYPEPRADAKLQTLAEQDEQFAELMWAFRYPEKGGKKKTYKAILAEVALRCGFTVSLSGLHTFYRWLELKRRWDAAQEVALQARAELAKNPDISDAELDRFCERVLKTEMARAGNVKGYVAIGMMQISREKQKDDRDRLKQASKSKIEAGLDALLAEIKNSPKALAAFQTIQAEVAKG